MMFAVVLSPLLAVGLGALGLMLSDALSDRKGGFALGTFMILISAAVLAAGVWLGGLADSPDVAALAPWILADRLSLYFTMLLCVGGALSALLAGGYLAEHRLERGEFYVLLLLSVFGAMTLAAAGDALTLFLGLETMSLGVYCLTAYRRQSARSIEGGLKYFLLSSFAAALLLYGFALVYGATGHTDLVGIGAAASTDAGRSPLYLFGAVLVLVGLVFKVSAVPFHAWAPDAYEGAPTPSTTLMAVMVKAAAFAVLLRVLRVCFSDPAWTSWASGWPPVVATLAAVTMTVANLVACRQDSVKRMLAYSSIAHAGYVLVGLSAIVRLRSEGETSALFYLLAYAVSTAGAFGALILCGSHGREAISYEDLSGLGKRHPFTAFVFSVCLLSLAGIPPTVGFFAKWFVFRAAVNAGLYALVALALVNSVIAATYYLRVLVFMYMREPEAGAPVAVPMRSGYVLVAVVLSAAAVIALGLAPAGSLNVAEIALARGSGS
ncbi:MAG: NADH-quinone oxidoreductase subunit N [Polyangiaceae bacterium]|jgi:NADH-quinone oxidoreductase subunit N